MSKAPTTTFHESYPLDELRPADYNPRRLSETALVRRQAPLCRHVVVRLVLQPPGIIPGQTPKSCWSTRCLQGAGDARC